MTGIVATMAFRIGGNVRRIKGSEDEGPAPVAGPLVMPEPPMPC